MPDEGFKPDADTAIDFAVFSGKLLTPDGHAISFSAPTNQPLLLSMEQAGIAWPNSCRNGTCRTCIGQLNAGTVHYYIDWPGLSLEEKTTGYLLPCVAYPLCDVELKP